MRCSNCGKDIPMSGKVCPWCKIDKTPDVLRATWTKLGIIGGCVLGVLVTAPFEEYGWGLFFGFLAGLIAGSVHGNNLANNYVRAKNAADGYNERQRVAEHAVIAHQAVQNQMQDQYGAGSSQYGAGAPSPYGTGVPPQYGAPTMHGSPLAPPPVQAFHADPPEQDFGRAKIAETDLATLTRQQEQALLASGDYRECPSCAEMIKINAKVCRFCNRDVVAAAAAYR